MSIARSLSQRKHLFAQRHLDSVAVTRLKIVSREARGRRLSVDQKSAPPPLGPYGPLDLSGAIGRFGVAYFKSVCAQAHIGFSETSPGEDVLALDGDVFFEGVSVRVQIKTTTQWSLTGTQPTLSYGIEEGWRAKWRKQRVPAFLVVVLLARPIDQWMICSEASTKVNGHALWVRIDDIEEDATTVELRRNQRLNADTFYEWGQILDERFGVDVVA